MEQGSKTLPLQLPERQLARLFSPREVSAGNCLRLIVKFVYA